MSISKPLAQLGTSDLEELITNSVAESKTLEFKSALPGTTESERKEFLADISSLANSEGGNVVYGIREKDGIAVEINGLGHKMSDAIRLRLDSMMRDGIEPRLSVEYGLIDTPKGDVLVIRVKKSWSSPHRVTLRNHNQFYVRDSSGKHMLDTFELRKAFNLSESLEGRLSEFRGERITKCLSGDGPLRPNQTGGRLLVHAMPIDAFQAGRFVEPSALRTQAGSWAPIGSWGWDQRINIDGCLIYDNSRGYIQLFRNTMIEAMTSSSFDTENKMIASTKFEQDLVDFVKKSMNYLSGLQVMSPLLVGITLVNVRGYSFVVEPGEECDAFDQDVIIVPEIVADGAIEAEKFLKPSFDYLWNACGKTGSPNYDRDGKWNPET
jgi:hypothetical protein